jgi:hypothetical protein
MRLKLRPVVLVLMMAGAGCVSSDRSGGTGGAGGSTASGGAGGTSSGGSGGSSGSGGTSSGGSGGSSTGGSEGADAARTPDAAPASDGAAVDSAAPTDAVTKPAGDGSLSSYEGEIPLYQGPPVGPEVTMDCPDDPTVGFTEYQDTFHVEHPYDLPTNMRFSIENGGLYNFWVIHGDKKHSPTSTAANPRTEARFSQEFKTGIRLFSADVLWDPSVTKGTVVMQVHTTSTGIGPVYMVANGGGVSPLGATKVPGGVIGKWINLKVLINADTTASQYWVNNCPAGSQGKGTRGDGNDYFKMGVYHCDSGTCKDQYKNVHLYIKQ